MYTAINTLLYKYILYSWLPTYKYTQRTTMYAPCTHNTQRILLNYTLPATYIPTYPCSSIRDYTYPANDHLWLKSVASMTTATKRNLARSHTQNNIPRRAVCSTDVFWYHAWNNSACNRLLNRVGQDEFNGCNFCGLMSVVSKWRATGDFAAVNRQSPKPKPRHMFRSYFSKSAYCLYHASAQCDYM